MGRGNEGLHGDFAGTSDVRSNAYEVHMARVSISVPDEVVARAKAEQLNRRAWLHCVVAGTGRPRSRPSS